MEQNEKRNKGSILKKVLSILMTVLIIMGSVSIALASDGEGDFTYDYYEHFDGEVSCSEGITITGYYGDAEELVIPETIDGQTVLAIDGLNLWDDETVVSITIPKTVVYIYGGFADGSSALENIFVDEENEYYESVDGVLFNEDMTKIVTYPCAKGISYEIPEGVEIIGDNAFSNTLIEEVTIPEGVTEISYGAFFGCRNLTNVNFPSTLTTICNEAFNASGIEEAVLDAEIEYIGFGAFSWCENLKRISIPENLERIEAGAFSYGDALEEISVHEENKFFCAEDNVLYNKDKTSLIRYASAKEDTSFEIPETVLSVEDGAFSCARSLAEVIFPENLKEVGKDILSDTAIYNNEANWTDDLLYYGDILLEYRNEEPHGTVTIKEGTKYISAYLLSFCYDVTEASLPEGLLSIGEYAFNETSIENVDIPDSVEFIGENAFSFTPAYNEQFDDDGALYFGDCLIKYENWNCESSYDIKEGTRLVAERAFYEVDSISELTIPEEMKFINDRAFYDCEYLDRVNYNGSDWSSIEISEGNEYLVKAYENPGWQSENCDNISMWDFCNDGKTVSSFVYSDREGNNIIVIRGNGAVRDYDVMEEEGAEWLPNWEGNYYENVYISKGITRIGANTFDEGNGVTVNFEGTEEEWADVEIADGNYIGDVIFESELYGHDIQAIAYKAPTCTEDGVTRNIYCEECGYQESMVTIPATHTDREPVDGECDECGEIASEIILGEEVTFDSKDDVFVFIPTYDGVYRMSSDSDVEFICSSVSEYGVDNEAMSAEYAPELQAGTAYYISVNWYEGDYPVTAVFNCCLHENTVEEERVEPTCESEGYTAGIKCVDCGNWLSGREWIEQLPHNFVSSEPYLYEGGLTCENEGFITSYCSLCEEYCDVWVPARCTDNNRDRLCDICDKKIVSLSEDTVYELESGDNRSYFIPSFSGEYIISSVDSYEADPWLEMYDEYGNYVYSDDISDDERNFSLTKELKAGVIYTVVTGTYRDESYKILITYTGEKPTTEPSTEPTEAPVTKPTTKPTEKPTVTTTAPTTTKAPVTTTAAPATTQVPTTTAKAEQPVKATKPSKVKIKKPKSTKKKQILVTWNKVKNANGYQVAYSTSKKFKKKLTKTKLIKKAKTTKTTLKKLKSGKKYFIKVRAYKTVNKKKVYGAYSKVVNVKVK